MYLFIGWCLEKFLKILMLKFVFGNGFDEGVGINFINFDGRFLVYVNGCSVLIIWVVVWFLNVIECCVIVV